MKYTAAIRTLGTAGEKYQCLLDSLVNQTLKPDKILVHIAEGYPIPKETVGIEEYIYVKKGMVAQRALDYKEINSDFILFLDDDLQLGEDAVEKMFVGLINNNLDVISPDIFRNNTRSFLNELMMCLSGRMKARYINDAWGYKVMRTAGYSYRKHINQYVYRSETNAGAAFLCRKKDFLKVNLKSELWLDRMTYPLGEDQTMYYKMHFSGLKVGTLYNHSFKHLDAGGNSNPEKEKRLIYSDFWFKTIFWHRFIFSPERRLFFRLINCLCIGYAFGFSIVSSFIKCRFDILQIKYSAIKEGIAFIKSEDYKIIPKILKSLNYEQ